MATESSRNVEIFRKTTSKLYTSTYILKFLNFHMILDITCWNPAFDVTPAHLIRGIITEVGVLTPPLNTEETLRLLLS